MVADEGRADTPGEVARALLLTDIVDSTRLAQSLGDAAMSALWQAHDRVARDLLRQWHGREIDRSDGFLLLFDAAADAAGYALDYHRALAALSPPLHARAGLHVGPVRLRENNADDVALGAKRLEVEGIAKPLAARVMSIAQGGQTLLTGAAQQALGATSLRLHSHGHWRMKGLDEPIEVLQLGDETTAFVAPRDAAKVYRVVRQRDLWVPWRDIRFRLPGERDDFVGRAEALAALARRFEDGARLVTVLGAGGSGKTRLATRYAWLHLGEFAGGCWFCDLSQARDVDGIVGAVAHALDVPLGKGDPVQQLGDAIAGRGDCLLLLDNFEQVARHAEDTLGRWLDRAMRARFLVTSREVLGVAGEQTLALAPLPADEARDLFMKRASAAKRDFALSGSDLDAIQPLMRLLDGLPLAVELCAARVRVMPPHVLLPRMNERFRLLASAGGRHDRQATLRATFDWSWDLLAAEEKRALAQLSVFEGGFTLQAAERVLDLRGAEQVPWAVDLLQSLIDKSLVIAARNDRFGLLGSIQEYAAARLRDMGAEAVHAAEWRHANFFAGPEALPIDADGGLEIDNIVAACQSAARRHDGSVAAGALRNAWAVMMLRGPYRRAAELATGVCALPALGSSERAWALLTRGGALRAMGLWRDAKECLDEAGALARPLGDRTCLAHLAIGLGGVCLSGGRIDEARDHYVEALNLALGIDAPALTCEVHNAFAVLLEQVGETGVALQHYQAGLELARSSGLRRWEAGILGNLGGWHGRRGELVAAQRCFEASLEAALDAGDRRWEGNALCNLGELHQMQGRLDEARERLLASLAVAREIGSVLLECTVLGNLGLVNLQAGQHDEALHHHEMAIEAARRIGDARSEGQFLGYLGLLHGRNGRVQEARGCMDRGEKLLRSTRDLASIALLLAQRAEVEADAGNADDAHGFARRARDLAREMGAGPDSAVSAQLARLGEHRGDRDRAPP